MSKDELLALEKDKIKGAIRTDFVLSAEIVVIILGSVADASFAKQVIVVSSLALFFTIAVYGFVAAIVKMDDVGLYLVEEQKRAARALLVGFGPQFSQFSCAFDECLICIWHHCYVFSGRRYIGARLALALSLA